MTSGTAAGFAPKKCAWSRLKETRREKTQLAKRCSHGAFVNQVPEKGHSEMVIDEFCVID